MKLHFSKYQGTGNDFILIDDREETFPVNTGLVEKLCDRRFGIGADGLILIQNHPDLNYRMVYFNSDGSQSLCGNGSRCGFAFAQSLGVVDKSATFETTDGVHEIKEQDDLIHFQLFDVEEVKKLNDQEWYINTGSPHHIVISDNVENEDIVTKGRHIRNQQAYSSQNGTNVNFAQLLHNEVRIRTYERGVEDETLSCGTGATAVGIMAGYLGFESPVQIQTQGGMLCVSFQKEGDKFTNIWLAGPAKKVFEGSVTI
ncbi:MULTISPECIES: diaminopimelate epimerase [unclassified Ekhidna]|jgi:diaminopimelate epimerase|uniref:diaminopimelate epimerase n=1 Tax=unclassified Ekhidna TaxID=2632188 RepID=UPI0032E02511